MPPLALLRRGLLAALIVLFALPAHAATPRVHAIVGARIVPAPGQVIENGTVVMRDGLIVAVGAGVAVPADARVWPGDSLTVYAGLIDAFVLPADASAAGARPPGGGPVRGPEPLEPSRGAASAQPAVRAEYRVVENLSLQASQLEALRAAGLAVAHVVPRQGVVRGTSAVVGLGDGPLNRNTLVADATQVMALQPTPRGYPGSLMGAIAVIRQAFLDGRWYRDVSAAWARKPDAAPRPETNLSWAALRPVVDGLQPVAFVADEMLEVLRAGAIAREAGVRGFIVTAGDEYKRIRPIVAAGMPLVVPVNFPEAPKVDDDALALEVTTEELRQWQDAPGNAAAVAAAGGTFAFTTNGLGDVKQLRGNVARAIGRGLSEARALEALTLAPARLLGLEARLGTIAPGKLANLTVMRGPMFAAESKVREVWVDGERYETQKDETTPKGEWTLEADGSRGTLAVATGADTTVELVSGRDTLRATDVRLDERRVRFALRGAGGVVESFDLWAANDALAGTRTGAGGPPQVVHARPVAKPDSAKAAARKRDEPPVASPVVMGNSEPWRMAVPPQPAAVLVRNATIWTAGPQGTVPNADLLVRAGRIAAIGPRLTAPAGAQIVDGTGMHVAPGIIDEHSHAAVLGNVNECTNNITCEVRIGDVVNSESVNIYRQLAAGITAMHLLHGSCNAIGGQCAVIKNRWGAAPDDLLMREAPPTVKFALGENPKQSNWGNERTDRYPKSRAGVEQSIREAFLAARDYTRAIAEHKAGRRALPPRRDVQLDALAEIVAGRMMIHCHSYRQDEILMLMRLAESFGIRVNTFTHILEGYKLADEMAAHGASAVGFSDWWGYKQEVIDAIPWNTYLMWDRGVNVGLNSDSEEMARRLHSEAAKAIKYGGMPPGEALKTVTLNPAKSLLVDARVGSLEPGKDADFAIWNGPPMSPYSRCEQTWIEGRRYFDRAADVAGRAELARERSELVARARGAKAEGDGAAAGGRRRPPRYLEDTDTSGNDCGGHSAPFVSEAARGAAEGSR